MGRPPGVKNGSGSHGAKNASKSAASGGGGKGLGKTCSSSSTTTSRLLGGGEKDKGPQDRSQSNFPYDIRLNGYTSLQNAVQRGTPKIKRILMDECDYIMECRVCRNLFRSLPNFITHKLNYCKKAFDSTWCLGLSNIIPSGDSASSPSFNIEYEVDPELVLINAATNLPSFSAHSAGNLSVDASRPPATRTRSVTDLYNEIAERTKKQGGQGVSVKDASSSTDSNVVRLQLKPLMIPGEKGGDGCSVVSGGGMKSVVVQQQIMCNDPSNCDTLYKRPREIVRKDTAILGPDGKVICTAPGKGIEQVVSRLTAQLKALEEKEAKKLAAMAKNSLICDVCKTVFDSDKAIRQHKRESLDCGKTWGFKSPTHEKPTVLKSPSSSASLIPSKRTKRESGETDANEEIHSVTTPIQNPSTSQAIRQSRLASPTKGRRPSHHHHPLNGSVLANKTKRNLALSPVKKIKMKYIKLDSSSRDFESGRRQGGSSSGGSSSSTYSCSRCSSSFTTKHEMSMHLALCTGSINYAYLKESEPPQEKIRISLRNDFPKASTSQIPPLCASPPSTKTIFSESHLQLLNRQRQMSGTSSSRGDTPTEEVNNNKHYKNSYQQHTSSGVFASSSSEEDNTLEVPDFEPLEEYSARRNGEEEIDSDITSHSHDSGVSSASSTKKKTRVLSVGAVKKSKSSKVSASGSTVPATKSKATKVGSGGGGMVSERPVVETKKTVRKPTTTAAATTKASKVKQRSSAFNLRKTVNSRVRKSRRILRPPPPPLQQQSKLTSSSSSHP